MIGFLAAGLFAALLSTVNAGADYKQMHVKFAFINGYYKMPTTVKELKEKFQDFVLEKHIWDLNVNAYAYQDNPQFSLLFDSYDNIAGIRTGYEKAEIPKRGQSKGKEFPPHFFTKKPGFRSETIWGIDVWSTYAMFTSPETLKAGGRNDTGGLVLDDLYLNSTGTFSKIDKNECQAENLGFRKQACFIGMGMHYFYNTTTSLDCDYANGQFLLYECNQLIGFGLTPFGSFATKKRTWFEDPPVAAVERLDEWNRASQQLTAMAATIAFLLIIATTIAGATADWKSLHVKYAVWDGYYAIPVTASKIVKEGFVKMGRDADLNADLYTLADDPRMIALFDTHGNIAGLRTSYIKDDVGKRAQPFPYSYDANPMMTSATYQGKNLWYATVLFVSPEMLKAGGRKDTGGLVAEDIYLKLDGNWTKISKDECKVEAQGFTKQACFIGMGMHYFYKVTPTSECEHFQGAFLLYESGELIGLGFNPFGTFTSSPKRTWFEDVPADVVTDIVPNGPPCIKDWVSKYGATSFHIFFKGFPRLTFCSWPWQKSDQCKG